MDVLKLRTRLVHASATVKMFGLNRRLALREWSMNMKQLLRLIMISILLVQGCVTQIAPGADKVKVIQDPRENNCQFRGIVTGSASMGWSTAHDAEGAFNDVMNKAAEKGANAIHIDNSDTSIFQSTAVAEAYYCEF